MRTRFSGSCPAFPGADQSSTTATRSDGLRELGQLLDLAQNPDQTQPGSTINHELLAAQTFFVRARAGLVNARHARHDLRLRATLMSHPRPERLVSRR